MPHVLSTPDSRLTSPVLLALCLLLGGDQLSADPPLPLVKKVSRERSLAEAEPWQPATPRAEISPEFSFDPQGGPKRDGALIITAEQRRGLHGCWQRTFAVTGGYFYRFEPLRKTENLHHPRPTTT